MDIIAKFRYSRPRWLNVFTLLVLCAGIVLSALAWMHVCSEACTAGHKYRLYGIAFEPIGIAFFATVSIFYVLSIKYSSFGILTGAMICSAVGAEIMFTYAQKAIIGHWCPICLSIAFTVVLAFALMFYSFMQNLKTLMAQNDKGGMMKNFFKGFGALLAIGMGFMLSLVGFAQFNQLHAMEKSFKEKLAFGNKEGKFEVYVFTDWKCPSCRNIEPIIEEVAPKVMEKARLFFVDFPIHDVSLNFTPYNLSFLINNKPQYFKLRKMLEEISLNTDEPDESDIEAKAKKIGITYKQLNYADVTAGTKFFAHLVKQFDVSKTPTVVVVNSSNKKGKKLAGSAEISEKNILGAIESVK